MEPSATNKVVAEALNSKDQREKEYAQTHYKRYLETWTIIQKYLEPPAKVLEVGPLMGHISIGLSLLGYKVEAVDIPEEVIRYHDRLQAYGIHESPCDLSKECLWIQSKSFDGVVFTEILEHLPYSSTQHAIIELSRVLKVGGLLFLSTPNIFNVGARLRLLFGRQPIAREHVREYSLQEIHRMLSGESLFRASGGVLVKDKVDPGLELIKEWYSLSIDNVFNGVNRFPRMILYPFKLLYPKFRTTVFLVARKR